MVVLSKGSQPTFNEVKTSEKAKEHCKIQFFFLSDTSFNV